MSRTYMLAIATVPGLMVVVDKQFPGCQDSRLDNQPAPRPPVHAQNEGEDQIFRYDITYYSSRRSYPRSLPDLFLQRLHENPSSQSAVDTITISLMVEQNLDGILRAEHIQQQNCSSNCRSHCPSFSTLKFSRVRLAASASVKFERMTHTFKTLSASHTTNPMSSTVAGCPFPLYSFAQVLQLSPRSGRVVDTIQSIALTQSSHSAGCKASRHLRYPAP
ncbi:hypothetical protein F5I97DRAFT_1588509 [Phlebopus sp. FC_14]|nr:hypothetical protein F5I97DRAFT_1588509 [Phlebopus sp. FC_14]